MRQCKVVIHSASSMAMCSLCAVLILASLTLAAQEHAAVSWVPYQTGCPILIVDLKMESDRSPLGLMSSDVQNVSTDTIEEITVGLVVSGPPKRLVATHTIAVRLNPGERQRLEFSFASRTDGPELARKNDRLVTLGAVRVLERGGAVWVSPVTIDGEFRPTRWSASEQARTQRGCQDDRHRLYRPGAVIFDQRHAGRICQPDGTWAPR